MALKDFPVLHKRFDELQAQIAALDAKVAGLRAERDKVQVEIQPLLDRERTLSTEIKKIEREGGMRELKRELAAIAKGTGGKRMSDG